MASSPGKHTRYLSSGGPSIFKLKIHKWVELRKANQFSVMVAQQAVVHADLIYKLMQMVRSQTMDHYLPGVASDETWLDLYQDHRAVTKAVAFVFEPNGVWP